jgi:predicted lipid-binding transport protein (Tim44 family)
MGDGFQFIDIILFAMVAAFLVLRLRSVLGKHKDDGRPQGGPPAGEPYARPVATGDDTVVPLPDRSAKTDRTIRADAPISAESAAPLDAAISEIRAVDPRFDLREFLGGARSAFEMVVQAFAEGDRKTLKQLLNAEVYENFEGAIKTREARNETLENTLIRIVSTDAIEAEVEHDIASVTVKIVSEQVNLTKNAAGEIVDGNPNHITVVTDIWTFSRDLRSRDPNWKLVATRSE